MKDPFFDGLLFTARPSLTWTHVSLLSGGQKTLLSLAFLFSLHFYKKNSIYFMDEIDAALDFKNRSIVAEFIKELSEST